MRVARICVGAEPGFVWASFSLAITAVVPPARTPDDDELVTFGWFGLN